MLAAGPTKTLQRIVSDVIATLYGNFLDRIRHIFNGNFQKPAGNGFGAQCHTGGFGHLFSQCGELAFDRHRIKRFILIWPEYRRKKFRLQLAKHDIAISQRQRPVTPVTGRAGIRASALRAHLKPSIVKPAY